MTVTNVHKDPDTLTMTLTAEFDAPPERVWQLWADARQLERWWGPPAYPATVEQHELRPGGNVRYFMTGPSGDQPKGYWAVDEVEPPSHLVFRDGFANDDWTPNASIHDTTVHVSITASDAGRTTMTIATRFADRESMEQVLAMGMEEGLTQAVGQIDAILAADR